MPRGKKNGDATDQPNGAAPGHNGPTDDQIRKSTIEIINRKRAMAEKAEELAALRGSMSTYKKALKKSGYPIAAMFKVAEDSVQDQDALLADEKEYIRIRAVMNMPWKQEDLFPETVQQSAADAEADEELALHRAYSDGYGAGRNAHDIDKSCPFDTGSEKWVKFREGWHAGQARNAEGLSRPERRGRRAAGGESAGTTH